MVSHGRKPDVQACGVCHRADGPGGPENSSVAGLPAAYIVQQMADFRSGARTSSVPQRLPVVLMISLSKAVTDAEVQAAAVYFSMIKPKPIISVVETDMVPKSYVYGWHLAAVKTDEKEPIGQRIIEVPEDLEQFVSRDTRSRFIAYGSSWGSSSLSASAAFCSAVHTCSRPRRWRRPSAGPPAASSGKSVWRAWGTGLRA